MSSERPSLDLDPFCDAAILDPWPGYQAIRDRAPLVWLEAHGVWAMGRYDDVRAALRADEILISSSGVGLNEIINNPGGRATLTSDGEDHRRLRKALMAPMMPRPLAEVRPQLEALANDFVGELKTRDAFDGIADFARRLPVAVVSHLVGLPEEGRESMLDWAAAVFNALGPMNERARSSVPALLDMLGYAQSVDPARLRKGGWAESVFAAVAGGSITEEDARGMLIDYIAPSLDTTILATGHMLYLLGSHPAQYARLRKKPDLVPAAVHESLRLGSPVRAFSRVAARDYETAAVSLAAGERVLVFYGAANLDERHYPEPERFDVTRKAQDHLAFGHGVHRCAGGHLAQLEMEALLRAVVSQVDHIEVGAPETLMSNMLNGYERFEVRFS